MNREQALEELKLRLSDTHVLNRSFVVEAMMQELALHLNADAALWGMAGLLHDIDYQKTLNQPEFHGMVGAEVLENLNFDGSIVYSVRAHNKLSKIPRKRKMDKSLYICDIIADLVLRTYNGNPALKEDTEQELLKQLEKEELTPEINDIGFSAMDLIKLAVKVADTIK